MDVNNLLLGILGLFLALFMMMQLCDRLWTERVGGVTSLLDITARIGQTRLEMNTID